MLVVSTMAPPRRHCGYAPAALCAMLQLSHALLLLLLLLPGQVRCLSLLFTWGSAPAAWPSLPASAQRWPCWPPARCCCCCQAARCVQLQLSEPLGPAQAPAAAAGSWQRAGKAARVRLPAPATAPATAAAAAAGPRLPRHRCCRQHGRRYRWPATAARLLPAPQQGQLGWLLLLLRLPWCRTRSWCTAAASRQASASAAPAHGSEGHRRRPRSLHAHAGEHQGNHNRCMQSADNSSPTHAAFGAAVGQHRPALRSGGGGGGSEAAALRGAGNHNHRRHEWHCGCAALGETAGRQNGKGPQTPRDAPAGAAGTCWKCWRSARGAASPAAPPSGRSLRAGVSRGL